MAQERPTTPERELLRLIEDPKATETVSVKAGSLKRHKLSLFSFAGWKSRASFSKKSFKERLKGVKGHELNFKLINRILVLCIFVLIYYFINNLLISLKRVEKMPNEKFKIEGEAKFIGPPLASVLKKSVSYYLEKIQVRNIFEIGPPKLPAPSPVSKAPNAEAIEAMQDFKLVGISWSKEPEAMIEDTKALKTFFVKKGQMINKVKIEAIFKDKVILSYKGQEVELR